MAYSITRPDFPTLPLGTFYKYLASVGLSEEVLQNSRIKEAEVVALNSRQTVTVLCAGVEYADTPVWIHTDCGAREATMLDKGANADPLLYKAVPPSTYFKDAALLFPCANLEETSQGAAGKPTVLVIMHTTLATATTPEIKLVLAVVHVLKNLFSGFPTLQRTYRPYLELWLTASGDTYRVLYDIFEDKIATIPTYPNYSDVPALPIHEAMYRYSAPSDPKHQNIDAFVASGFYLPRRLWPYSPTVPSWVYMENTYPGNGWSNGLGGVPSQDRSHLPSVVTPFYEAPKDAQGVTLWEITSCTYAYSISSGTYSIYVRRDGAGEVHNISVNFPDLSFIPFSLVQGEFDWSWPTHSDIFDSVLDTYAGNYSHEVLTPELPSNVKFTFNTVLAYSSTAYVGNPVVLYGPSTGCSGTSSGSRSVTVSYTYEGVTYASTPLSVPISSATSLSTKQSTVSLLSAQELSIVTPPNMMCSLLLLAHTVSVALYTKTSASACASAYAPTVSDARFLTGSTPAVEKIYKGVPTVTSIFKLMDRANALAQAKFSATLSAYVPNSAFPIFDSMNVSLIPWVLHFVPYDPRIALLTPPL